MEEIITLLSSPFVVAETIATMSLEGSGFESKKPLIQELSNKAQSELTKHLVSADTKIALNRIPVNWHTGLQDFFDDILSLFPGGLLPTSAWDRINRSAFFFPSDVELDWVQLLDLFIRIWRELPKPIGHTEKKCLQFAFGLICQHLAFQRLPYDENVVFRYVTEMGNQLEKVYKEKLFYSLQYYEQPPLRNHLMEVEEIIARFNQEKLHVRMFEVPPFGKPGDTLLLPLQDYIDSLDGLLDLYQAKINVLSASVKRENDQVNSTSASLNQTIPDLPVELSHPQIALLFHCNGERITRNNRDSIARKFGKTSETSGQKLHEVYKELFSELSRTAKGKYTIKNYEAIIDHPQLTERGKAQAKKELGLVKKINQK